MYDYLKQTILCLVLLAAIATQGQPVKERLAKVFESFENDAQLSNAIASLYVVDARTGAVVFDKNSRVGLAPASTQKVITAATAYALLGKNFRYKTEFGFMGTLNGAMSNGVFYILPSYDPTLGSWRWESTKDSNLMAQWLKATNAAGDLPQTEMMVLDSGFQQERVVDGWIWQDIGNYYGAGAGRFNWRENQFDVLLRSGSSIGSKVEVARVEPQFPGVALQSFATAAAKGTGDNAYVYYPQLSLAGVVRGTIPVDENAFRISASLPDPALSFSRYFTLTFNKGRKQGAFRAARSYAKDRKPLHIHYSPTLDSINYWFQKKSINLYGEALIKTISFQQDGSGTTEKGLTLLKNFWKEKGIPSTELAMVDGSGLSPLNRVTTLAQVAVLRFAKEQEWFAGYYDALPVYNDMKMKSGTINGAKGFCGYHKAKDGTEYVFSFLVNNFNGSASSVVRKMYKVLDVMK